MPQPRLIFFYARFPRPGYWKKPVSIGAVDEGGEQFYAENSDIEIEECEQYVRKYVLPLLERGGKLVPQETMFRAFGNWIAVLAKKYNCEYQIAVESNWETLLLKSALGNRWPRALRQDYYVMRTTGFPMEIVANAFGKVEEFLKTNSERHALNQAKAIHLLWDGLGRPAAQAGDIVSAGGAAAAAAQPGAAPAAAPSPAAATPPAAAAGGTTAG